MYARFSPAHGCRVPRASEAAQGQGCGVLGSCLSQPVLIRKASSYLLSYCSWKLRMALCFLSDLNSFLGSFSFCCCLFVCFPLSLLSSQSDLYHLVFGLSVNFLVNLQVPYSLLPNPCSCKSQNDVNIMSSSGKAVFPSVLSRNQKEEEGPGLKSGLHYQLQLLFCPYSLSLARIELKTYVPYYTLS